MNSRPSLPGHWLVLLFIAFATALAAQPATKSAFDPELLQHIQNLKSSVPPELAAHIDLTLFDAGAFTDKAEGRATLRSAFDLAAQSPYAVRKTLISGNVDTRSGYLSFSYDLALDTLSLRTQAVARMLPLDRLQALEMFRQIGPLHLEAFTCKDTLAYDVSSYYKLAGDLYTRAFDQVDKAKDAPAAFLESLLGAVDHSAEVVPAEELLLNVKTDPDSLARAASAFARALTRIDGDARSYNASEALFIVNLFRLDEARPADIRPVLLAARAYIAANLSTQVCSDTLQNTPVPSQPVSWRIPRQYADLNRLFAKHDIPALEMASIRPASVSDPRPSGESEAYWQSPPARQRDQALRSLRQQAQAGNASTAQWQHQVTQFVADIRNWNDASTEYSAADLFMEKALLFSNLLSIVPPDSPVFPDALNDYVAFLSTPPTDRSVQVFWIASIAQLFRRLHRDKSPAAPHSEALLAAALAQSPNPTVALYADLERLAPQR
jgi:hypothetical protein